jgi:hypothetical protein
MRLAPRTLFPTILLLAASGGLSIAGGSVAAGGLLLLAALLVGIATDYSCSPRDRDEQMLAPGTPPRQAGFCLRLGRPLFPDYRVAAGRSHG